MKTLATLINVALAVLLVEPVLAEDGKADRPIVATFADGRAMHESDTRALRELQEKARKPDQIENALKSNGPLIRDTNGVSRRRLDVDAILLPARSYAWAEYLGCSYSTTQYLIQWASSNGASVDLWDADFRAGSGGDWYNWYEGTATEKAFYLNASWMNIRVRGKNGAGWGPFATISVDDKCDTGGGPHPKRGD